MQMRIVGQDLKEAMMTLAIITLRVSKRCDVLPFYTDGRLSCVLKRRV